MSRTWTTFGAVFAGAAAAIGASACCLGPLLLVLLGVGGAWGSRLVAMEAYQPFFLGAAVVMFFLAFYRLYFQPTICAPGDDCALPAVRHRQRQIFWFVVVIAVAAMAFPLYASIFY